MLSIEQKERLHQEFLDKLHNLYVTKNRDYGDSVHRTYEKYGMTSYLVRIEDKINRVQSLTENGIQRVNDEKLQDTLLDAANYLILAAIELENDKSERVSDVSVLSSSPILSTSSYSIKDTDLYTFTSMPDLSSYGVGIDLAKDGVESKGGVAYEHGSSTSKND